MSEAEDPLHRAVEGWYAALAADAEPDRLALCGGDEELAARLDVVVGREAAAVAGLRRDPARPPVERLGDFVLGELIGAGGMGRVHLAAQEPLGRLVAVKIVEGAAFDARFRREAEITAALDHPSIVPVHAVGTQDGLNYIAMKWLSGPSLDTLDAPLDPITTARIGAAVARALDAAHAAGVVHRDVKPGNVILDGDHPYVVDFGLARSDADHTLTQAGAVPGTLAYLPPERLDGTSRGLDPRSDVYSLGATLYEVVSGRRPHDDGDAAALTQKILLRDPRRLPPEDVGHDFAAVIEKALEKKPADRYPTAAAFAEDLERVARSEPVSVRLRSPLSRLVTRASRRPRLVAALAAALAIIAALTTWALVQRQESAARFRERLVAARTALEQGRLQAASDIAATLAAERPDDGSFRAFSSELDRRKTFERLLDNLLDVSRLDRPLLRTLLTSGDRLDVDRLAPEAVALARAMAARRLGDDEAAATWLDAYPDRRGARIVSTLVRNDLPDALPEEESSPDEDALAAIELHRADAPRALIDRLLTKVLDGPHASHRRGLIVWASLRFIDGEYEEALRVFGALSRRDDGLPLARRYVAHCLLRMGRLDEARDALLSIATDDRGPLWYGIRSDLAQQAGEDDWSAFALGALATWPDDPGLLLVRAQHAAERGAHDESIRTLERILEKEKPGRMREIARSMQLSARAHVLLEGAPEVPRDEWPDATRAALAVLRADAEEHARSARFRLARSTAHLVVGWTRLHLEGVPAAVEAFEAAIKAAPQNHRPRSALVHAALNGFLQGRIRRPLRGEDLDLVEIVEEYALELVEPGLAGHGRPRPEDVDAAHHALVRCAYLLGEAEECVARARAARPRFADDSPVARILDWFIANLER